MNTQGVELADTPVPIGNNAPVEGEITDEADMTKPGKSLDRMSEEEIRKLCGQRIKKARLAKSWTLADVTKRLEPHWGPSESVSRMANYEAGVRGVSIHQARILGRVLECSAAWLLCVDDTMGLNEDLIDLVSRYAQASPQIQGIVRDMLKVTPA